MLRRCRPATLAVDYSNAIVARAARPAHEGVVGRGARGDVASTDVDAAPRWVAANRADRARCSAAFAEATRARPIDRGRRWDAATRWRRRSGAGVFAPGDVCDVVGTAEPVCAASAEPREDPTMLVECHPHADPDAWLLENPGFVSGGNLRWWRDQFAPIERDAEAVGLGRRVRLPLDRGGARGAGRRGTRVPAVHAGRDGSRVERRGARRVLRSDPGAHARPHDARRSSKEARSRCATSSTRCETPALDVQRLTIVGGGAKGPLWRQIKADVTGLPVRVPVSVETTATGAAILAVRRCWACTRASRRTPSRRSCAFRPDVHEPNRRRRWTHTTTRTRRYRAVYAALRGVFGM